MTARGFGLLSLLIGLSLVGGLWALDARQNGPASKQAQRVETQAAQAAAGVSFGQAAIQLESWKAENGTYAGASVPASYGVQLVRADATSYCLQAGVAPNVQHEISPGGSPVAGHC